MSPALARVIGVIGLLLYVAVGFFYLTSGLVVPGVALVILWVVWLAGIWLVVRVFTRRPEWTFLVAVGAAVFWFLYLNIGSAIFGWTA
jgi:hypothetical protein